MAGMDRRNMGLASAVEIGTLDKLSTGLAEVRSLGLLRRHHLGGVAMAKAALGTLKRPEVRSFAERVILAQTAEVTVIDTMLKARTTPGAPAISEQGDRPHD